MNFREQHTLNAPLLLCNVWDVPSAKIAEKLGFQAIGTSSAAIAATLGREDGEQIAFSELFDVVERIVTYSDLPLTVDIESGYSRDPNRVVDHIRQLAALGVVGVNIEDSLADEERALIDGSQFASGLSTITEQLSKDNVDVFINVRTDVFLVGLNDPIAEAKQRIPLFEKAGADGIFVPGIEAADDIRVLSECCSRPMNVMCMPNLPDFRTLKSLGVQRVSMGNFLFNNMCAQFENTLAIVQSSQSFKEIFCASNE